MYLIEFTHNKELLKQPTLAHTLSSLSAASRADPPMRVISPYGRNLAVVDANCFGLHWQELTAFGDLTNVLLDELAPYVFKDGSPMPPWCMPREDWLALMVIGKAAYGLVQAFPPGNFYDTGEAVSQAFRQRMGYGLNGPLYDGHQTNCRHEVHIKYALLRGEDVPASVLEQYRQLTADDGKLSDCHDVIALLLDHSYARGKLSATAASFLSGLAKAPHKRGVVDEPGWLAKAVDILSALPVDATYVQADDALYQAGLLVVRQPLVEADATGVEPFNATALDLANFLQSKSDEAAACRDATVRAKGNATLRELEFCRLVRTSPDRVNSHQGWANNIISAIESKDVERLLVMFDNPDNKVSKQFLRTHYQVDLLNCTAADRHSRVFDLAGIHCPDERQKIEADLAEAAQARKTKRELSRLKEEAAYSKFRLDNAEVVTGDRMVEILIERGHTEIRSEQVGAVQNHWIVNPEKLSSYRLKASDHTLQYARALLSKQTTAATATEKYA